jgi:hypothetical protein
MTKQSNSKLDRTAGIIPSLLSAMPYHVMEVTPLDGFRLYVRFRDGTTGEVDMSGLIKSPRAGVFAVLSDPTKFAAVFISHGVVSWPGELDLAPDTMHDEIAKFGRWVLN